MEHYRFVWSPESLIAPIRSSNGLTSVIPNWSLLQAGTIDPDIVHKVEPMGGAAGMRLGIITHAYTISDDFLRWIERAVAMCEPSAIVFTTDTAAKQAQLESFLDSMPSALPFSYVLVCENVGRDVVPFWRALEVIAPHADVFLKLHWKLSPHLDQFFPASGDRKASNAWNDDIYHTLIPASRQERDDLLSLFGAGQLASIYPRPWPPVSMIHWYSESTLNHGSALLGDLECHQSALLLPLVYPLGNMFYGSVTFFERFIDHFLARDNYPSEPIPVDGTVLHAIERIYTHLAACSGYDVASLFPSSVADVDNEQGNSTVGERRLVLFPVANLMSTCDPHRRPSSNELTLPALVQTVVARSIRNRIQNQRPSTLRRVFRVFKSGLRMVRSGLFRQTSTSN